MTDETRDRIDAAVKKIETAAPPNKAALVRLLRELRDEIGRLDVEQADSVAGFAEAAAREATRKTRVKPLLTLSLQGLAESVSGFEASHPRLVETIGEIGRELSSLGI